jgi:hypothetical protein
MFAADGVSTGSRFLLSLWERLGEGPDFVGLATGSIRPQESRSLASLPNRYRSWY